MAHSKGHTAKGTQQRAHSKGHAAKGTQQAEVDNCSQNQLWSTVAAQSQLRNHGLSAYAVHARGNVHKAKCCVWPTLMMRKRAEM